MGTPLAGYDPASKQKSVLEGKRASAFFERDRQRIRTRRETKLTRSSKLDLRIGLIPDPKLSSRTIAVVDLDGSTTHRRAGAISTNEKRLARRAVRLTRFPFRFPSRLGTSLRFPMGG